MNNFLTPGVKAGTLVLFLIIILAFLGTVNGFIFIGNNGSEFRLPVLVIDGAVIMIGVLGFASVIYAMFDLDDKQQALALPEGSIRAVIAIMLIVMFAIMSIYLFNSISSAGGLTTLNNMADTQVAQIRNNPAINVLSVTEDDSKKTSTIIFLQKANGDGTDLAKQLVVLLGTLVTAISSFYFGSRAASNSSASTDQPASAKSVFPSTRSVNDTVTEHQIVGSNLAETSSVALTSGTTMIDAEIVSVTDGTVSFKINSALAAGHWDVRITSKDKKSTSLKGAITVA